MIVNNKMHIISNDGSNKLIFFFIIIESYVYFNIKPIEWMIFLVIDRWNLNYFFHSRMKKDFSHSIQMIFKYD